MVDLFDYAGAKGRTADTFRTSADAADAIAISREHLQRVALRALADLGAATPLEVVARTGRTKEAIQPRLSEMIALGMVKPTGKRRQNPSGRSAAVLTITPAGRLALGIT